MRLGRWVKIYNRVIPVPAPLSTAFGISQGSQLHIAPFRSTPAGEEFSSAELLLTPIPPTAWKSAVRLSFRLRQTPGALRIATQFLRDLRINILITEACLTYKGRAHWDALCDLSYCKGFDALLNVDHANYERRVEAFLEGLNAQVDEFIDGNEGRRAFLTGDQKNAKFSPVTGLNDAAFECDFQHAAPVRFDAGGVALPDKLVQHVQQVMHLTDHGLPQYAMITGNTEQRYMRIQPIADHAAYFFAVVESKVRDSPGEGIGVLNSLLSALPEEINLIHLANHITAKDEGGERGRIRVLGRWPCIHGFPHLREEIEERLRHATVRDVDGGEHQGCFELVDFDHPRAVYPRVFVSYSTRHAEKQLQYLRSKLTDNGFDPVVGTDYDEEPTEGRGDVAKRAFDRIPTCVAFVSLAVPRDDFCCGSSRYILPPWSVAEEVFAWTSGVKCMLRLWDRRLEDARYNRNMQCVPFGEDDWSYRAAVDTCIDELNKFRSSGEYRACLKAARTRQYDRIYPPDA